MSTDSTTDPTFHVVFKDVTVSVPDGKKRKTILKGVSGYANPGEVLGIMGPSGAGKTTLLNALAGRLEAAKAKVDSGDINVNDRPITKRLKRKIGYVLQQDILFPKLTVRQSLEFAAQLRLPRALSYQEKISRVDDLIEHLGIQKCQKTTIGGGLFDTGISGGEKKRVSIGVEMITDPPLLFMDEPTTGLDSSSAASLITLLKKLAMEERKTVICTLHQPSSQIFYTFDKLLLLCEGRVAYFGATKDVVQYFSDIGLPCHPNWNPADDLIEKLKSGSEAEERICNEFERRYPSQKLIQTAQEQLSIGGSSSEDISLEVSNGGGSKDVTGQGKEYSMPKWEASFTTQVKVLTQRTFVQSKGAILDKWNLLQTVIGAVVVALIWLRLPQTEESLTDRNGLIFFSSTYWMFTSLFQTLLAFPEERPVVSKERASGMYRLSAYFAAKNISELPVVIFQPLFFWIVVYWACGLQASTAFLSSLGIILLNAIVAQSVGLLIGALVTDLKRSIVIAIIVALGFFLAGGYLVRKLPSWFVWFRYISLAVYPYIAMLYIEYTGADNFRCKASGSEYSTCLHSNTTSLTGDEILKQMNLDFELWECLVAMFGMLLVLRSSCYFAMRGMNKSN